MKRKTLAALAGLMLVLSGCAADPAEGDEITGGRGGPAVPGSSETAGDGNGGGGDGSSTDTGDTDTGDEDIDNNDNWGRGGPADPADDDDDAAEAADYPAAGTVRLNWERPEKNRIFEYEATECYVGEDYISVEGVGSEVGGGAASTVHIFTTPRELLHERTRTYSAEGIVRFTVDGTDIVSDGRHYTTPEGYSGPSMFEYRLETAGADYRALWWAGSNEVGAGAVKVKCHHDE